jgi:dihydrofolate synthase/folylpolyglutamate synthase
LAEWLARLEQLHPSAIDLGLERVRRVRDAMGLTPAFPLIVVGGTNGKGSTCATLEAILGGAGYKSASTPRRTCCATSVRSPARSRDADLVRAFERVDAARAKLR